MYSLRRRSDILFFQKKKITSKKLLSNGGTGTGRYILLNGYRESRSAKIELFSSYIIPWRFVSPFFFLWVGGDFGFFSPKTPIGIDPADSPQRNYLLSRTCTTDASDWLTGRTARERLGDMYTSNGFLFHRRRRRRRDSRVTRGHASDASLRAH